jgi:hypothetical protein
MGPIPRKCYERGPPIHHLRIITHKNSRQVLIDEPERGKMAQRIQPTTPRKETILLRYWMRGRVGTICTGWLNVGQSHANFIRVVRKSEERPQERSLRPNEEVNLEGQVQRHLQESRAADGMLDYTQRSTWGGAR